MRSASSRSPVLSVRKWPPTDAQVLAEWLDLHVSARPTILDCTYGSGKVWGHLPIRQSVIKCDIEPRPGLDHQCDWRELPHHLARESLDAMLADPIHVPDVGRTSTLHSRYVSASNPVKGPNVAHLFPDLLDVAEQLVKPRTGVLIVVHAGRRQWQDFALVDLAKRCGWTACDRAIVRNMHSRLSDDKHKARYHTRNEWAEWLCFRDGPVARVQASDSNTSSPVWCVAPLSTLASRTPSTTNAPVARRLTSSAEPWRSRSVRRTGWPLP